MGMTVLKLSGSLSDDPVSLDLVCQYISEHKSQVVVVHGGGKQINEMCAQLGIPVMQVAGRRITTPETMDVLLKTVGGSLNRGLVSDLRSRGLSAVGLTGADGGLTTSHKRPPLVIDGVETDFQLVGELDAVDPSILQTLLAGGYVPVIACLTWSEEHGVLNINADTFAIAIANALSADELVFLMEPEAVLDAEKTPISHMTKTDFFAGVSQGWITDGMRPKLETGFKALESGIKSIKLTNPAGLAQQKGTILS
jgi:acetylglutamate kinase